MKKLADATIINSDVISNGQADVMGLLTRNAEEDSTSVPAVPAQNAYPASHHDLVSDKPELKDVLHNH